MLDITLGNRHLTVSRGAYKSMYAPTGWTVNGEEKKKKAAKIIESKENEKSEEKEDDPWADVDEDEAVDIDSMNAKALKRFAREKGLDPDSYKTLGELKKALKPLV